MSVFLALCGQPVVQRAQWMHARRSGPAPPKNGSLTARPGSDSSKRTPTSVDWNVSSAPRSAATSRSTSSAGHSRGLVVAPSIRFAWS